MSEINTTLPIIETPNKSFFKTLCILFLLPLCVYLSGYLLPEKPTIPVQGASQKDWHPQSFWFYPWGRSGVHKGIDIFAKKKTSVLASTHGLVLNTGTKKMGGKYVLMLGSGWRLHYFAHLDQITTKKWQVHKAGSVIETVGDTGNAKGKPPHLHWSIRRVIPLPWKADSQARQGQKKSYFINPNNWLGLSEKTN